MCAPLSAAAAATAACLRAATHIMPRVKQAEGGKEGKQIPGTTLIQGASLESTWYILRSRCQYATTTKRTLKITTRGRGGRGGKSASSSTEPNRLLTPMPSCKTQDRTKNALSRHHKSNILYVLHVYAPHALHVYAPYALHVYAPYALHMYAPYALHVYAPHALHVYVPYALHTHSLSTLTTKQVEGEEGVTIDGSGGGGDERGGISLLPAAPPTSGSSKSSSIIVVGYVRDVTELLVFQLFRARDARHKTKRNKNKKQKSQMA